MYVALYTCIDEEGEVFRYVTDNLAGAIKYEQEFFTEMVNDCEMEADVIHIEEKDGTHLVAVKQPDARLSEVVTFTPLDVLHF